MGKPAIHVDGGYVRAWMSDNLGVCVEPENLGLYMDAISREVFERKPKEITWHDAGGHDHFNIMFQKAFAKLPRCVVKLGKLVPMPEKSWRQKCVDVNMAVSCMRDIMKRKVKQVMIFSNDLDLLPILEECALEGIATALVTFENDNTNDDLAQAASSVYKVNNDEAMKMAYRQIFITPSTPETVAEELGKALSWIDIVTFLEGFQASIHKICLGIFHNHFGMDKQHALCSTDITIKQLEKVLAKRKPLLFQRVVHNE